MDSSSAVSYVSKLSLTRAVDENTDLHGWDETFDDRQKWQKSTFRASISSHAVAHKTIVCGTVTRVDEEWITWKTSFAPHQVCRVASNLNGSIIAATMDNGTVSILRGSDGVVLATRRVAKEGIRVPAEISFVSDETLLIVPPEDGSTMILVSSIDGERLNSNNQGVVSEATRTMVIHSVRFDSMDDIRTIRGNYFGENNIRFGLVDGDGKLSIYDYDIAQKHSKPVQSHVRLGRDDKKNWEIDFDVGIRVQTVGANKIYLVVAASFESKTQLFWLDFETFNTVSDYIISKDGVRSPRLMSLELLSSCRGSVAVAIGFKFGSSQPKIETRVLQAAELNNGESIGIVHEVFTIPVPSSVKSLSIAPIEIATGGLYSFRCKTWMGDEDHDCYIFKAANNYQDGSAIASVRLLATSERYDEANDLVRALGAESLICDPFARFHPSEIALCRLLQVLSSGGIDTTLVQNDSREYIRQLVVAAHSGNEYGQLAFLSAANGILEWPDEKAMANPPSLTELVMALKGFLSAMTSVSSSFKGSLKETFNSQVMSLEGRIEAFEYLGSNILGKDPSVKLNFQFSGARSSKELLACLIQNGYFITAEQMWKSSLRGKLSTEALVAAVLKITPAVDPREYASLLEEGVFPSLAINHELLPSLLTWSCETADAFDDANGNCFGLDEAIFLLEVGLFKYFHACARVRSFLFSPLFQFFLLDRFPNEPQNLFAFVSMGPFRSTCLLLRK